MRSFVLVALVSNILTRSKDFEVLDNWKSCGKPSGFISDTPGTCRSAFCQLHCLVGAP